MKWIKIAFVVFDFVVCGLLGVFLDFYEIMGITKTIVLCGFLFFVILFIIYIGDSLIKGYVLAYFEQKKIGRFKGLWSSENLAGELKRNFEDAQTIKIKVTRGTELFESQRSAQIRTYLEKLNEIASPERGISCQFLLIAPCAKIHHVNERYEIHKERYPKMEDFLESWYKTIENIENLKKEKNNRNFRIEVRFYSGRHSKWRFYIFESRKKTIKTVLFSDYDAAKRSHGSDISMYKVLENGKNIGGFMERYFDEIWQLSLTKAAFKEAVNNKKCLRKFCEDCDTVSENMKECQLKKCPMRMDSCPYISKCMEFVKKL